MVGCPKSVQRQFAKYLYATLQQTSADRVAVIRTTDDKRGSVLKVGPNHYRAFREFGACKSRDFQGPVAMVTNESDMFYKAASWAVVKVDSFKWQKATA